MVFFTFFKRLFLLLSELCFCHLGDAESESESESGITRILRLPIELRLYILSSETYSCSKEYNAFPFLSFTILYLYVPIFPIVLYFIPTVWNCPTLQRYCPENCKKKHSQKGNCAASVPISTFFYLINMFPPSVCLFGCSKIGGPILGTRKSLTDV